MLQRTLHEHVGILESKFGKFLADIPGRAWVANSATYHEDNVHVPGGQSAVELVDTETLAHGNPPRGKRGAIPRLESQGCAEKAP
jgi:hypothetical protein